LLLDDHIKDDVSALSSLEEALLRLEKRVQTRRRSHHNARDASEEHVSLHFQSRQLSMTAAIPAVISFVTSMLTINRTNLHDKIKWKWVGVANMATLAYRFLIVGENIIFTSSIFIMLPPRPNQSSEFGTFPGENELIAFSTRPD
jgi:hypothetical protein